MQGQIEYLANAYVGQLPQVVAVLTNDIFAKASSGDVERPTKHVSDYPLIGRFVQSEKGMEDVSQAYDRAAEALATIAGSLDRIEGAALVLVTADPDEPDDPSAREVRLVSFERDGGLLAQAFETMAASLDGGAIEEAAPAPRLN